MGTIYVLFLQLELLISIYDFWCLIFLARISCHKMIIDRKREETIYSIFKKSGNNNKDTPYASNLNTLIPEELTELESKVVELKEFDIVSLERDPGKCIPICEHPINQRDEIRRAYIKLGPYQPKLFEYPRTLFGQQRRRFQ